jgi:tRNA (cytidine32/guanosine34-2'-O)-methyltransferase
MMRGVDPIDGVIQSQDPHHELLGRLVGELMESAEHPPSEVEGVSDEFIEQLERVPKKNLKADMSCPICSNPFLEGTCSGVLEIERNVC